MSEVILSAATKLAWQLAGDLAFQEKEAFIEPRHLLFGICSIGKVIAARQEGQQGDLLIAAKAEADRLDALARRHGLDLAALRRQVRKAGRADASRISSASAPAIKISRSLATRQIFENAAARAPQVDLLSLFWALVQSHDSRASEITSKVQPLLAAMAEEIQPSEAKPRQFALSMDARLHDLDQESVLAARSAVRFAESIDASLAIQPKPTPDPMQRLAQLSELTWEFGTGSQLEGMLRKAVEQLLRIIQSAERCAILVNDPTGTELLLKAHGPLGTTPMISMTSARRAILEQQGFIWVRGEDLSLSQKESTAESGMYVPLVVNKQAIGVICLDSSATAHRFAKDDLLLVNSLGHQLALAIANHNLQQTLQQNATVLQRLLTNFSPQVRTRLLQRAQMGRLGLGGEKSVVTILCADIRGFTQLSASLQTEDVVSLLNEYFAALIDCIFRHDGTIDKFVGDAILAVFGSPEADPDHCGKAVIAGIEMQEAMSEVSRRRASRGDVVCQIGVGIHTGEVLHGFIGSPERMEFTVIGDTVNRAARYCDAAKASELLMSPEVHERVWKLTEAEQVSISTKHEGDLLAYRVNRLRVRT